MTPRSEGPSTWIAVSGEPLDVALISEFVADPGAGCSVVFTGVVRDHSIDRPGVTRLEYEAYGDVVEEKIAEVVDEARSRWNLLRVAVVHRVGTLGIGEPAVVVAVSSGHRKDAFPAASFVIDALKERAPIWKKEHWSGGAEWVEGA